MSRSGNLSADQCKIVRIAVREMSGRSPGEILGAAMRRLKGKANPAEVSILIRSLQGGTLAAINEKMKVLWDNPETGLQEKVMASVYSIREEE